MVSNSVRLKMRLSSLKLEKSALVARDIRPPMTHGRAETNVRLRLKQRGLAGSGYEANDLPARFAGNNGRIIPPASAVPGAWQTGVPDYNSGVYWGVTLQ